MQSLRLTDQFKNFVKQAIRFTYESEAVAILLLLDGNADWKRLKNLFETSNRQYREERSMLQQLPDANESDSDDSVSYPLPHMIVAANTKEELEGSLEEGFDCIELDMSGYATNDRLNQALLDAVLKEHVPMKSSVVTLYSAFDSEEIDTISLMHLDEHLDKLTLRDLRDFESTVPLKILRTVIELAIEIGHDGCEGRSIGTLFVIGDSKKVLEQSSPAGFDPVRGYGREERNIMDSKVREGIKEIAQLDGAFIISSKGIVEAACRTLMSTAKNITLSKGMGARHSAAAAISKSCKAVSVSVSQSGGTVRVFQNGEVVLRIDQAKDRVAIRRENPENKDAKN